MPKYKVYGSVNLPKLMEQLAERMRYNIVEDLTPLVSALAACVARFDKAKGYQRKAVLIAIEECHTMIQGVLTNKDAPRQEVVQTVSAENLAKARLAAKQAEGPKFNPQTGLIE